jgi:hypothetical protein
MGRRRHSAKWDRCVREVAKRGGAADPAAVCTAAVPNPRKRRRHANPRVRSTAKMPPGLRKYWRARNAKSRRLARAARDMRGGARRRRRNPGATGKPKGFIIMAWTRGKRGYYDGSHSFVGIAGAQVYETRATADRVVASVRKQLPAGWDVIANPTPW